MAIKEVPLGHAGRENELLTLSSETLSFNAEFIANNNLQKAQSVKMLIDDEDPYFLGMKFFNEAKVENCLALQAPSDRSGNYRRVKCTGLYSAHKLLKIASQVSDVKLRAFEIIKDIDEDFYKIYLRPMFENRVLWESKNQIKPGIGIYRYIDSTGAVVYIGKGNIRDRATSQIRDEWGVVEIQYSLLKNDEDCFEWEAFYLDEFLKTNGALPAFNRIKGKG